MSRHGHATTPKGLVFRGELYLREDISKVDASLIREIYASAKDEGG